MDTLWILYRHTLALRGRATAVHDLPAALPHFQAATRANPVHHAEPPVQPSPNRLFWRKTTKTQTPKPSPRETHRAFLSPLTLFSLALSSSLSLSPLSTWCDADARLPDSHFCTRARADRRGQLARARQSTRPARRRGRGGQSRRARRRGSRKQRRLLSVRASRYISHTDARARPAPDGALLATSLQQAGRFANKNSVRAHPAELI